MYEAILTVVISFVFFGLSVYAWKTEEQFITAMTVFCGIGWLFLAGVIFYSEITAPKFHEVSVPINGEVVHFQYIDEYNHRISEERVRFLISLWSERKESADAGAMEVVKDFNEWHNLWAYVYITPQIN